jgi:hypothetical protein
VQYRSHPALMDFINQQFYSGLLSNGVAAADRPAPDGFPSLLLMCQSCLWQWMARRRAMRAAAS